MFSSTRRCWWCSSLSALPDKLPSTTATTSQERHVAQRFLRCFCSPRRSSVYSVKLQLQHLAGCLQDLAASCNYLGRSVLGSCIIDGLCSHRGSVVNIYEDWGEKEKTKQQLWLHWIFIFIKSSSSSVFLTEIQAPGEDTLTIKCNTLVESLRSRGIPSIIGIVWPASCSWMTD